MEAGELASQCPKRWGKGEGGGNTSRKREGLTPSPHVPLLGLCLKGGIGFLQGTMGCTAEAGEKQPSPRRGRLRHRPID